MKGAVVFVALEIGIGSATTVQLFTTYAAAATYRQGVFKKHMLAGGREPMITIFERTIR